MNEKLQSRFVFISYKREESDFAERLRGALENEGYEVWWDKDLQCGQAWEEDLDQAVQDAACIIVVWSELAAESKWVRHEASQAIARRVYAPCRIGLVRLDSPYDRIQATDIIDWDGNPGHGGFKNLVERLNTLIPPKLSLPQKIGRWISTNLATIVASTIAAAAILLLLTIFLAQRADREQKVYDCSTGPELRAELAIKRHAEGMSLKQVCLSRTNLRGIDFDNANFTDATLAGATLRYATLANADLTNADLTDANLTYANLTNAILHDADLTDAILDDVTLANAELVGTDLSDAALADATLANADLGLANLTGANLTGANLSGADLSLADFTDVRYLTVEQIASACANPDDPPILPEGFDPPPACETEF